MTTDPEDLDRPFDKIVELVCSPKPRARTGSGGRNNEWWKREVFHIARDGAKTWCGANRRDWLEIGPSLEVEAPADRNCCTRCAKAFRNAKHAEIIKGIKLTGEV